MILKAVMMVNDFLFLENLFFLEHNENILKEICEEDHK